MTNNDNQDNNKYLKEIKFNDNIFTSFKNHISIEFQENKKEIQELDNHHYLVFNQYLPNQIKESPCIEKENKLIECLGSNKNKDFIICSDILNEFTKCQEKYIKEL